MSKKRKPDEINSQLSELAKQLAQLGDLELREVLFEVFQTRRPNPEEDKYSYNRFFLGTAAISDETRLGEPAAQKGRAEISAVAYIDRELCPETLGPDWGFCQFGTCSACKTTVRSNYKNGICPVCGAKVGMT
ncbi:MAG: hypothetical protein KY445_07940 [Armatimonadetes bacterium]|nr:hypothetical protein [Armatimonadota bacterium]